MIVTRKGAAFVAQPVVYVLEIDKWPVLAFEAVSGREAAQLIREAWLKEDLLRMSSNGQPLWGRKSQASRRRCSRRTGN
jgi:hypothetical protein